MLIAKIINPVPQDYRAVFPNTSFPTSGPSDEFLSERGFAKVNMFKEHDRATQKLVSVAPYYEAPWVYTVAVVDKTLEDLAAESEVKAAELRAQRNRLLTECDWTQLDDTPMTNSQKLAWASYRQALRDLTTQPGFPSEVTWPEQP